MYIIVSKAKNKKNKLRWLGAKIESIPSDKDGLKLQGKEAHHNKANAYLQNLNLNLQNSNKICQK